MPAAPNGIFPRNGVPANQAAPGAQIGVDATCDDLFYAARCNPRVDIQSLNTIISEIVNAVNCADLAYDCDELDNLCRAIRKLANDAFFECLEGEFPDAGEICGEVTYLVLSEDENGCQRIARMGDSQLILNNPVIYLRKDAGSANPNIRCEADLTVDNAFNSFNAVRAFMNRTLTVGTVTVDARGDFASDPSALAMGNISASTFNNAQDIVIRGDPNNPGALIIPFGGTSGRVTGMLTSGSGQTTVRDLTFRAVDGAVATSTNFIAAINAQGGNAQLAGTVRFDGYYDPDRPGAATGGLFIFRVVVGGSINISDQTVLEFDFDAGTTLVAAAFVGPQSTLSIQGNVVFRNDGGATFTRALFDIDSSGLFRLVTSVQNNSPLALAGPARHIAPYSYRVPALAVVSSTSAYGNRPDTLAYDFGADVSTGGAQAVALVDAMGVVDGVAGP